MAASSSHRVIGVWGSHGGSGASCVAANVGAGLAHLTRQPALIIDLSLASGAVETWLGVAGRPAGPVPPWQSPQLLKGYLPVHPSGAEILSVAGWPVDGAPAWADYLDWCAAAFPWVIVDAGIRRDAWAFETFDRAALNLMVVTGEVMSERGWGEWRRAFEAAHLQVQRISRVMNKARPADAGGGDLGSVLAVLPKDDATLEKAMAHGELPVLRAQDSALGRALHQLILKVQGAPAPTHGRNGHGAADSAEEHDVKRRVHLRLVDELKKKFPGLELTSSAATQGSLKSFAQSTVEQLVGEEAGEELARDRRSALIQAVMDDALGLGPLEDFMRDPEVTEIMVNGKDHVFIERGGRLERMACSFESQRHLLSVIERIVVPIGRRIDESVPMVDARLPDGSRVNAIIPPLALNGPTLTIRKFSKRRMLLEDLVRMGSLSQAALDVLKQSVATRRNIVVSGGTGSGKTTLLNALSGCIPREERIVTIEDAAELQLDQPHVVRLESRPPNLEGKGAVMIRDLVKNALRMRPDRIIVGECRSGEALDMLQAMNTGHDGSLTTVHANTPRDALSRIETMVLMAGMDLPLKAVREQVASAVHVVVQVTRTPEGPRKITQVTQLQGLSGDNYVMKDLMGAASG